MALGSLVVSLGLDAAQYTQGLTKAEYQARQLGEAIGGSIRNGVGLAVGALSALGISAGGAVATFDTLINSVGDFQDLAERTGASAEGLASFAMAAGTAGTTVEAVGQATIKLTKNLTGVDDESKAAGAAVAALGLNLGDFKKLSPEDQITEVSKALAGFEDGAGKTAVATALLGKSGAELLPFLKTLEEQGGRQVILTDAQIQQADEYGDKQSKLKAQIGLYAQVLATNALPALTAFTGATKDAIAEMLGMGAGVDAVAANKGMQEFAEGAVKALGFVVDAGDGVVRIFQVVGTGIGAAAAATVAIANGDISGAKTILSEGRADIEAILNRETFGAKLAKRLADLKTEAAAAGGSGGPKPRPVLTFDGAEAKAKKEQLDAAAKYLEALQKQLQKADELSVAETTLAEIQSGRLGKVTAAQREALISTARQIDAAKVMARQAEDMEAIRAEAIKAADAQEKQTQTLVDGNTKMAEEIELIGKTEAAQRALVRQREAAVIATKEEQLARLQSADFLGREQIALEAQIAALKERMALGDAKSTALITEAETKKAQEYTDDFGKDLKSAFQLAFNSTDAPLKAFGKALQSTIYSRITAGIADSLTSDLLKSLGLATSKSESSSAGGLLSGLAGLAGKFFGSSSSGVGGTQFLSPDGSRANGGPVRAGGLFEVGENGDELLKSNGRHFLIPGRDGVVTPGVMAAQAGAGGGVSLNQAVSIDARGAGADVMGRIQEALRQYKVETVAAVQNLSDRGAGYGRSMGRVR